MFERAHTKSPGWRYRRINICELSRVDEGCDGQKSSTNYMHEMTNERRVDDEPQEQRGIYKVELVIDHN